MDLIDIGEHNFTAEVLGSELPFLLDLTAPWCPPCDALAPIVAALAREYAGRLRVGKLDIDRHPDLAARLRVRGAPTLVVFRQGRETARQLGLVNKKRILELLEPVLSPETDSASPSGGRASP